MNEHVPITNTSLLKRVTSKISKRVIGIFVVVLVLIIAVFLGVKLLKKPKQSPTISAACASNRSLMRLSKDAMNENNTAELDKIISRIVAIEGYEKDVNCLTPVLYDKILNNRQDELDSVLGQLKAAYANGSKLDGMFDTAFYGSQAMEKKVEAQKLRQKVKKDSTWTF